MERVKNMNSDIQAIGMAPVIHEFMGKQRKLRNLTMNEDIDLEVIVVELNNLPTPDLKLSRTVEVEETDSEGQVKKVKKVKSIPQKEALKTFKKDVAKFKADSAKIREQYLLLLFADGEITPEEIENVTSRDWAALRNKLNRQHYYDMGMTDSEIDDLEKQAVKGAAGAVKKGVPNTS
jgi:hypothetical protein